MKKIAACLAATLALIWPAAAQVKIGVIVSATGPAASVGVTQQRTVQILPSSLGGQDVDYVLLDDASDTSTTVKHAQKLITEDGVDAIVGPSLTPNSLALLDMVTENKVPLISMAGSALIVDPVGDKRHWVFKTPQSDKQMASVVLEHLKKTSVKSIAFIGFSDAYGEGWIKVMTALVEAAGIEVVASERYQRTDSSVTGQVLKIVSRNPEAVFIAASGTPAALPQTTLVERGFRGAIYQTHGVAN
ncbi:ABC transporter substrate-binding protein, partial [Rhizobiaceae sp. 2RAB30]